MLKCFTIALLVLLTGCANLPSASSLGSFNGGNYHAPDDNLMATWVSNAKGSMSLRLANVGEYPATVQAMKQQCSRGLLMELIIPASEVVNAAALQHSCVSVFASWNPDMTRSSTAGLMDGATLLVDGHVRSVSTPQVRQEYFIQQSLKSNSRQLQ